MKATYQVWTYNASRDDFSADCGEYDNLKTAISIADEHTPAVIELIEYDEEGYVYNVTVIYCAFENDESEMFFKQKFPRLSRFNS